jgi:hypothetical protein
MTTGLTIWFINKFILSPGRALKNLAAFLKMNADSFKFHAKAKIKKLLMSRASPGLEGCC